MFGQPGVQVGEVERTASKRGERVGLALVACLVVVFAALIGSAFLAGPVAVNQDRIAFNPVTLRDAHRAVPPEGAELDAMYARANAALENALPRSIDLQRTGSTGANAFACTTCIEWKPAGRTTQLPPNPRGPRIWRVHLLLGGAISGRGPGLVEVWFTSADDAAGAALSTAGWTNSTVSWLYRLADPDTQTLLDIVFPSTE